MAHDPFKLTGPTCLSFSGGSTSAYMLWRVLQANTVHDLKRWLLVCFANTGREDEATLRFVREVARQWSLNIVWLEFRDAPTAFVQVDFFSASRDGEPFEALIRKRNYLPNPVTRFCTVELKIRTMHRYIRSIGFGDEDGCWDQMVGIRADEPRRVSKIRARGGSTETKDETMLIPLADAGVSVQEVDAFWEAQDFRLELTRFKGRTLAGNCDLCFLKPPAQRLSLIREKPQRAVWWIRMEKEAVNRAAPRMVESGFLDHNGLPLLVQAPVGDGAKFVKDGASYAQMAAYAEAQFDMFAEDEEGIACFCGD